MNRRLPLVLSVAAIAALTTGCATISDNDDIARVGDATLTSDAFEAELADLQLPPDQPVPGDAARFAIGRWIQQQLVSNEELAALYDAGFESSGTLCIDAIVVPDEPAADQIAGELGDGADFDELFAAENIDPGLTATGGALDCITADQVAGLVDTEFVQVATGLRPGDPPGVAPVLDQTGAEAAWVVVVIRPFADLEPAETDVLASTIDLGGLLADADVFIDPRYGTLDTTTGQVVALG